MRTTRDEALTAPFVIAMEDLRTIDNLCNESFSSREFRAECSDSLVRHFTSLDDLSAYDNPRRARITKLTVSARSPDYRASLILSLGTSGNDNNIYFSLDAESQTAAHTNSLITDWLEGVRPWYSFLARSGVVRLLERLSALLFLIAGLMFAISRIQAPHQPVDLNAILNLTAQGIVFVAPCALAFVVIEIVRERVFPMGTFRIGQGDKRHKDLELWRTVVVLGFVVSLAAGIFLAAF
jgi:hypothetical protein